MGMPGTTELEAANTKGAPRRPWAPCASLSPPYLIASTMLPTRPERWPGNRYGLLRAPASLEGGQFRARTQRRAPSAGQLRADRLQHSGANWRASRGDGATVQQ